MKCEFQRSLPPVTGDPVGNAIYAHAVITSGNGKHSSTIKYLDSRILSPINRDDLIFNKKLKELLYG